MDALWEQAEAQRTPDLQPAAAEFPARHGKAKLLGCAKLHRQHATLAEPRDGAERFGHNVGLAVPIGDNDEVGGDEPRDALAHLARARVSYVKAVAVPAEAPRLASR